MGVATAPQAFAFQLHPNASAVEVAPPLCTGFIGHRALSEAALPPGCRPGIYRDGSSGCLCH